MVKYYKFSNINESENLEEECIEAAIENGLGEPDYVEDMNISPEWHLALLIYGDKHYGDKYVYSYESGRIINDTPVNEILHDKNQGDYLIIKTYTDDRHINKKANFLDDDGFTLDTWLSDIVVGKPFKDRYHIVYEENVDGCNLMDINGETYLDDPVDDISYVGDNIMIWDTDSDTKTLVDTNGKIILEGIEETTQHEYKCYDEDGKAEFNTFYEVEGEDSILLYDKDMKLLTDIAKYVDERDDMFYITSHDDRYNILGSGCKLVFGKSTSSDSDWLDELESTPIDANENLFMVGKDDKYNIYDKEYSRLIFKEWFDDIKFASIDYLNVDCAAFVMIDNKCNIYVFNEEVDDPNRGSFIFNIPVDDIKVFDEYGFVSVTRDNKDYLLWKNFRLITSEIDDITQVEDNDELYEITENGKIDFLSTYDDETFCDKYMGGNKFDNVLDKSGEYFLVEYKGKYGYIDSDLFKPAFDNHIMVWFDKAEPCSENSDGELVFHVVDNGVEKHLDSIGRNLDEYE